MSSIQSLRRMISVELIKVKNLLLERKKRLHEVEGDYNENDEPMNPGITQEVRVDLGGQPFSFMRGREDGFKKNERLSG